MHRGRLRPQGEAWTGGWYERRRPVAKRHLADAQCARVTNGGLSDVTQTLSQSCKEWFVIIGLARQRSELCGTRALSAQVLCGSALTVADGFWGCALTAGGWDGCADDQHRCPPAQRSPGS